MLREIIEVLGSRPKKQEEQREWEYGNLSHTPYLHSSDYLNELAAGAKRKSEYENILDHIYNHQDHTFQLDSYMELEKDIVDKLRRNK